EIRVATGSRLRALMPSDVVTVNTAHHQAVRRPGAGWRVSAESPDGVVEAIERGGSAPFAIGVEWHPELMPERPEQRRLFEALVKEAHRFQEARGRSREA
ncbi:MAG TPA: gamma-glutamyl-gamma-aminobutyrate hydrolase family protein, partial [bacterium]|nr:gamma-glutamyl-gamma-aminobutyrate hydrolase family protein [bacterium]